MKFKSLLRGLSFGLTSGIITTLGLIVGLNSSTGEIKVIISGILIIAIADAMSDAFGIHMAEESAKSSDKKIWEATISTFLSKLVFASTFIVPFLIVPFEYAITTCIIWGLSLITIFSYFIAHQNKDNPVHVIGEHVLITIIVIVSTNYIGQFFSNM